MKITNSIRSRQSTHRLLTYEFILTFGILSIRIAAAGPSSLTSDDRYYETCGSVCGLGSVILTATRVLFTYIRFSRFGELREECMKSLDALLIQT